MGPIAESKVDQLEQALKQKIENLTGYNDPAQSSRKLEATFKYFDTNQRCFSTSPPNPCCTGLDPYKQCHFLWMFTYSGSIDFNEFFAAMVRMNFVGVQREIEALFDRYDENCDGTLDYREFAQHLFGMGEHVSLDYMGKCVIERIKAKILASGGG
jgi:hypothetical protein